MINVSVQKLESIVLTVKKKNEAISVTGLGGL
jgi:hypothetical protein